MFSKLFGTKKKKKKDEPKDSGPTYSIYLKAQFGKIYHIDGLNNLSTIYDVKKRLEIIAGVAFSKMMLTDDRIAKRLGVPEAEYSFPDEVLLKDIGITDGEVLIWKKFHEKYMDQISPKKIKKHQKNKNKSNVGFGSGSGGLPYWAKKEENKIFSIALTNKSKDDEKDEQDDKNKLLVQNLTVESSIGDIMKCIQNDKQKRFKKFGLYKNTDVNITKFWQIRPDAQIVWHDLYERYIGHIEREIEEKEQTKLYEINYKLFETGKSDEKQDDKVDKQDDKQVTQHLIQSKVEISKLLQGDEDELDVLNGCLSKRGWILVEYPDEIKKMIEDVCQNVFNTLNEKGADDKWEGFHQFGYQEFAGYKQVLRVLTGDLLSHFGDKYPKILKKDIETISNVMDKLIVDIIDVTLEKIWGFKSMEEFMKKAPVSIVCGWKNDETLKAGMIDFVKYVNETEDDKNKGDIYRMFRRGVNVDSHTDPGLFSLSFLSTSDGLQLYDILTKQWVSIPIDCGVLWCGEAAPFLTSGRIKSGIHRVMLSKNGKARFTAWYEACHHNQISRSVINDISQ